VTRSIAVLCGLLFLAWTSPPAVAAPNFSVTRFSGGSVVRQDDPVADLAGTQVRIPAGLDRQNPDQNGLAALVAESILQTPVDGVPLGDSIAGDGGSIVYDVGPHDVRFYLEGLPASYGSMLGRFRSALARPDFSAPALARARTALGARIARTQQFPLTVGLQMLNRTFYTDSDAGMPPLGLPQTLAGFVTSDAQAFFSAHYLRGGAVVSAAGKLSCMASGSLDNLLGVLRPGSSAPVKVALKQLPSNTRQLIARRDIPVPWLIALGQRAGAGHQVHPLGRGGHPPAGDHLGHPDLPEAHLGEDLPQHLGLAELSPFLGRTRQAQEGMIRAQAVQDLEELALRLRRQPPALAGDGDPAARLEHPMGVRQLHYQLQAGRLLIGTEISAIRALAGAGVLDEVQLAEMLLSLPGEPEATVWKGISRLAPGTSLSARATCVSRARFWEPATVPVVVGGDPPGRLREALRQAVSDRLLSSRPGGALVSGGLDSSSIAALARDLLALGAREAGTVKVRFPQVQRRVGGYNVDALVPGRNTLNLAHILVGSEGTLGLVVSAKVNLVPLPAAKAVLTIEFEQLLDALAATPVVLRHRPSAVEVMDKFILDHAKESPSLDALRRSILDTDPGALLCVELYGDRPEDLLPRLDALERDLAASGYRCHWRRAIAPAATRAAVSRADCRPPPR